MKVFLYRLKDTDDRDACAYIDNEPLRFECGHYFGGVNLCGSCYCGHDFADYDDIETILTKDEYEALIKFNKDINSCGFGITKGDDRYQYGVWLCESIRPIYDKLNSDEAKEFFEQIWDEEKEILMYNYSLDEGEITEIVDSYGLEYRDRSIIEAIWNDTADCGYDEAESFGYIDGGDSITSRYFDYKQFGEDIASEEPYFELSDGRVVRMSY